MFSSLMNHVRTKVAVLFLTAMLLLAACSSPEVAGPDTTPDGWTTVSVSTEAFLGLRPQAIPTDPLTGQSLIDEVSLTVFAAGAGEPLTFELVDGVLVYAEDQTASGTVLTLTSAEDSVTILVPVGSYRFVSHAYDGADLVAYGNTTQALAPPDNSVVLAFTTLLGSADLAPRMSPTRFVLPGQLLDVMLTALAPNGASVPLGDFEVAYTLGGTGANQGESGRGVRVTVGSGNITHLTVTATLTGLVADGSTAIQGSVDTSLTIPVYVTSGVGGWDDQAPTVTFDEPGALSEGVEATLTGTVDDDVAVARVELFDGPVLIATTDDASITTVPGSSPSEPATWGALWTPLGIVADLTVVATDSSGNQSSATVLTTTQSWSGTIQFGTTAADTAYAVATHTDGSIYVAGTTSGQLDPAGEPYASSSDVALVKFNAAGVQQWVRTISAQSGGYAYAYAVTTDPDGNVIVAATHNRSLQGILGGQNQSGTTDIAVIKYDADGDRLWAESRGTSNGETAHGVVTDASGNIYVAGHARSGFDGQTAPNANSKAFVLKYSPSGAHQWTRLVGTDGTGDYGFGVASDGTHVYLAGTTGTTGAFPSQPDPAGQDWFVAKYDTNGNQVWVTQHGTAAHDRPSSVAVSSDGYVYLAGGSGTDFSPILTESFNDAYLVKFSADTGAAVWTAAVPIGILGAKGPRAIAVDSNNDLVVVGRTGTTYGATSNGFIAKYDGDGIELWLEQFVGGPFTLAYGLALDADGSAFVTGSTNGSLHLNTYFGSSDMYLVKFDAEGQLQ